MRERERGRCGEKEAERNGLLWWCDGGTGEMENTFDIETLATTISSGKKEGIDGEPSISNRLAVCFVAFAPSEKPLLLRDGSLAYEALYSLTRPFYFEYGSERNASRAEWDVKCHAGYTYIRESIQTTQRCGR